jgi:hypothetical protein
MPIGLVAALSSVAGGISQGRAAGRAAAAQAAAAERELALQTRIYDETSANFAPFRESGLQGYQAYLSELGLADAPMIGADANGEGGRAFGGFQQTPGTQFALARGMDAINSSGAARGNYLSGANLAGAVEFSQGLQNQEYNNYLARLQGVGQQGQAAAGNQAAAGQAYASGAGNALAGIGNAQAAGAIGQGNAWSGATNNLMGTLGYLNTQNNGGQGFWGQNIFGGGGGMASSPRPAGNPFY